MRNTAGITDKIILFICCFMIYLIQTNFEMNVVIILIPIIFSAFLSYFDNEKLSTALTTGFSILACFVPQLIVFFPLIAYDMLFCKYQYYNLVAIIPVSLSLQSANWRTTLVVIAVLLVSSLLRYRTKTQTTLRSKHNDLIDEARQLTMILNKQNKDLIEKQDFELSNATLNERNRIAREIHDNVGHLLSSAILQSGALLTVNRDEKMTDSLKTLKDTLNQAMNSIRASVHQLYDESVDLKVQIMEITGGFTFCELTCDYQISGNPDKKVKAAFIAVVKEALSNVIRHSNATAVSVVLREHPGLYQLIIRDNGTVRNYSTGEGLGLKNMTDRIEALKGNINILTSNGFEIFISVPKEGTA